MELDTDNKKMINDNNLLKKEEKEDIEKQFLNNIVFTILQYVVDSTKQSLQNLLQNYQQKLEEPAEFLNTSIIPSPSMKLLQVIQIDLFRKVIICKIKKIN